MPPVPAQEAHDLGDFVDFLRRFEAEGFELAVIGGQAVGAYADLLDEPLQSVDLDICVTSETLREVLAWVPREGLRLVKRPQAQNVPVAVIDYEGKEINVLSGSSGLPPADVVVRTARIFTLSELDGLEVPVADPFDLLANKLALRREKDLPHIEILRRFVEREVVRTFEEKNHHSRVRLAPARRLLEVLGRETLPKELAQRLVDLAASPVDYRFLMSRVPTLELARQLLSRIEDTELFEQLEEILASRDFSN